MMQRLSRQQVIPLVLVLLALSACRQGLLPPSVDPGEGSASLVVEVDAAIPRTLQPALDLAPASYLVCVTDPGGSQVSKRITGSQASFTGLEAGDFTVTVEAFNSAGTSIGIGQSTVTLVAGSSKPLKVKVGPHSGTGTLDVVVSWPLDSLASPALNAVLRSSAGNETPLPFTVSSSVASLSDYTVPTGYYTLIISLLDGTAPVAGAAEVARILKNETTTGVFSFREPGQPGAGLELSITPQMEDPLQVTLSGVRSEMAAGETMTVSAAVSPDAGGTVYSWYLDGLAQPAAAGSGWTFGSDLASGTYRLDVIAFNAGGTQAGSASATFHVSAPVVPRSVALAWDANSEADLAGYKLYYGTASGSYGTPVDVGKQTTYQITGLDPVGTWYFAVTAYNTAGQESGFSNEVVSVPQ